MLNKKRIDKFHKKPAVLMIGPSLFRTRLNVRFVDLISGLYHAVADRIGKMVLLVGRDIPLEVEETLYERLPLVEVAKFDPPKVGLRRDLAYFAETKRVVQKYGIDIVTNWAGSYVYGLHAALVGSLLGKRVVVRTSSNEIKTYQVEAKYRGWRRFKLPLDRLRELVAFSLADGIVIMSQKEFGRVNRITQGRKLIRVCAPWPDPNLFNHAAVLPTWQAGGPLKVLYVGRKTPVKGYDLVFAAAKQLEHIPAIQFTLIGEFEGVPHGPNVRLLGLVPHDEIVKHYLDADLLLLPSRHEGFPRVVLEAMSLEIPCLLSRQVFEDTFSHKKDALLCLLDASDIVEKLKWLQQNPQKAQQIALRAHQRYQQEFSFEAVSKAYAEALLGE